ncbi:MAG: VirK/YbjX family protein [Selenomonas sp.]|uniref:DUF535 family protein n=1 Tax=Selenomonas sp. TaxID=2053611 RepID=UPI0025E56F95|nr:DUF535 family protein [Selenomonas sp.]MCR5757023.1 VirK/YbjX family protein [Selenomonas sp.]
MLDFIAIGRQIYRVGNWREAHRLVVFVIRAYIHYPALRNLYVFFEQDKLRKKILTNNKFPIEQATRSFFYKESTIKERVNLIKFHFQYLQERVKNEVIYNLYHDEAVKIWQADDKEVEWKASLVSRAGQRKEGLLAIEMRYDEINLYQMMIWINQDENGYPALWIGAMQGPNTDNAKNLVKEATKRAHRYRTKNLIFFMTQILAKILKVEKIYAVSNNGYYAMNHIRCNRKLKTDFGAFWEEVGGKKTKDNRFFELPLNEKRKSIEEIPTRKRAVYRKRFMFQDDVANQIFTNMENVLL